MIAVHPYLNVKMVEKEYAHHHYYQYHHQHQTIRTTPTPTKNTNTTTPETMNNKVFVLYSNTTTITAAISTLSSALPVDWTGHDGSLI